ncbi:Calcineurin subunit B type 1, partial [Geodia barretti]
MGAEQSVPDDVASKFEADEIRRLSHSFNKLDLNKNGSLSVDEFLSIPELQQNPLVRRVIDILDTDRNGEVDFQEFIQGVSQFSVKGEKEKKLRCELYFYDDSVSLCREIPCALRLVIHYNNLQDPILVSRMSCQKNNSSPCLFIHALPSLIHPRDPLYPPHTLSLYNIRDTVAFRIYDI